MTNQQNEPTERAELQRTCSVISDSRTTTWTRESPRLRAGSTAMEGHPVVQFEHLIGEIHRIKVEQVVSYGDDRPARLRVRLEGISPRRERPGLERGGRVRAARPLPTGDRRDLIGSGTRWDRPRQVLVAGAVGGPEGLNLFVRLDRERVHRAAFDALDGRLAAGPEESGARHEVS